MIRPTRVALRSLLIAAGVMLAAMGLKGFLLSSNFIDGGVTGVSMLLSKATALPLAIFLPAVNLPFVVIGFRQLGLAFALRSIAGIAGLGAALAWVPFPDVTPDPVLTAVFGGMFLGAGIGLAIRGGAVLDGTEIAALLISRRSAILRVGDVILVFNAVLFLVAMSLLGVEPALYSILTYMGAAKTLDFVLHGIDEFTAMTIVSSATGIIRDRLTRELGRGVTIFKGRRGLTDAEQDIVYCVVTRLEIGKVSAIVRESDPAAFVTLHTLSAVEGGLTRSRALEAW